MLRKKCAMLKVKGNASFKESTSVKRFGSAAIDSGCNLIIFDMAECLGMDSTFMGVMAELAMRVRTETNGRLIAMNLTPKTLSLLSTLGLNRLIDCYQAGYLPQEIKEVLAEVMDLTELPAADEDKLASLTTMLEAHRNLVKAAPENMARFKDVISFLDQDLKAFTS